jgi:hypothetical protein
MNYREIIAAAWHFAQEEKRPMYYFAFLPALITALAGIFFVVYQGVSLKRYFEHESGVLLDLLKFVISLISENPEYTLIGIVTLAIGAFMYLFYPSFSEAALIEVISRKLNGQTIKMRQGVQFGFKNFFAVLEFNGLLSAVSITALIGYGTIILRTLGPEFLKIASVFLIVIGIISIVADFLFTYAKYYIVIDDLGVFAALGKSTKLVINNFESVALIFLMLFLIGLRIIVNIVLILIIPGLIVLIAGFFASIALNITGYVISAVIGLIGIYLSGYLGGVVSVFAHAVWTLTFLKLTSEDNLSARDQG